MQIKTLTALSEKSLDKKVNQLLSDFAYEIVDIKFATNLISYNAMIIYKERAGY